MLGARARSAVCPPVRAVPAEDLVKVTWTAPLASVRLGPRRLPPPARIESGQGRTGVVNPGSRPEGVALVPGPQGRARSVRSGCSVSLKRSFTVRGEDCRPAGEGAGRGGRRPGLLRSRAYPERRPSRWHGASLDNVGAGHSGNPGRRPGADSPLDFAAASTHIRRGAGATFLVGGGGSRRTT